jgi:hypothetical protein
MDGHRRGACLAAIVEGGAPSRSEPLGLRTCVGKGCCDAGVLQARVCDSEQVLVVDREAGEVRSPWLMKELDGAP